MAEKIYELRKEYEQFKKRNMDLNMERGWPCTEQLELSMPMLDLVNSGTELCREVDYRGYGGTGGIQPIRELFAAVFDVSPDQIYVGGTMSTTIMYDIVNKAVLFGLAGHKPWKELDTVKFICPSPGYEKHFKICKTYGIEMVPVKILEDGPDMDMIEDMVLHDASIKGIWCVPLYSNPTGTVYSDEVVTRLAGMKTAAEDFRIFWDNAYCVHHLTDEKASVKNIIHECRDRGHADRAFEFASTSKITFPGGGVGLCVSSKANIEWLSKSSLLQLKTGDKINQLRHALFFKDLAGIDAHMKKHRDIIRPKFELVDRILHEQLDGWNAAKWTNPKGGYFINLELLPGMAKKTWQLCKEAGVSFTPAGSTFPYGIDAEDKYLRLAPTYPSMDELKEAITLLCIAIKIVYTDIYTSKGENDGENR